MKGTTIVLDHIGGVEAAAKLVDGRLSDFLIDVDDRPRIGSIHRVRADRPMKGQGGLIVKHDQRFFLRGAKGIKPGDEFLVQVGTHAEPHKATPVSSKLVFKSRFVIVTPDDPGVNIARSIRDDEERDRLKLIAHESLGDLPFGLILRSSCAGGDADDIAADLEDMIALASSALDAASVGEVSAGDGPHVLAWRDWVEPADVITQAGSFEQLGVLDQLETLRAVDVRLGTGSMIIEPTSAFVAVDINTGGATDTASGLKTNLAAAKDLPRQLRLRGLGGQIVVDFAPMTKNDRKKVDVALRAAFKTCPVDTVLAGWTTLGNFELQRKRERLPVLPLLERSL